jgi:hypothetical protein
LIFTEVKEVHTTLANFDADYLPGHTFCFIDMLTGFLKGNTIGGADEFRSEDYEERDQYSIRASQPMSRC